ncbi:hypothetical protein [Arthrobacter sp. NicSoilB11]|uniref:hypothetical protein n=1 Tax=Arthrobacter sp. NicSoilB11 TaxID=2830999 RepID=UPI001CC3902B|nr:hypothetical protein [Arthrobacter sp. NicSoilB11]BCW75436.1 hypothetical protein NicSoilB11_17610 [Arthrobacter sp. NicSoilB11]
MPLKTKDRVVAHSEIKVDGKSVVSRGDKGVIISTNGNWGKSYVVVFVPAPDINGGYPVMIEGVTESQITPV